MVSPSGTVAVKNAMAIPRCLPQKYLWDIDGQLQGQHHIDNLSLFMENHYIPDHEIEAISSMLLSQANSPLRFKTECSSCHGEVKDFIENSLWVSRGGITGMQTGMDIGDFLPTHQELQPEDVSFYQKLFARIAGKSWPVVAAVESSEMISGRICNTARLCLVVEARITEASATSPATQCCRSTSSS